MLADTVVDVGFEVAIEADFVGGGEDLGVAVGADLRICLVWKGFDQGEWTYEAAEDLVTWLDTDGATAIVDGCGDCGLAIRSECAVETDTLHSIVHELVICLGCVQQG